MITGLFGALVGLQNAFVTNSIDPTAGGYQPMFYAVTAAVIGGTAMLGGTGTIIGAFLGAIVIGMLTDGFMILGVSANPLDIIFGAAVLVAMIANVWLARLRERGAQVTMSETPPPARRHPARRAHLQELRRGDRAHRHQPAARQGRGARPHRRQRRGQVHAAEDPVRLPAADLGPDPARGRGGPPAVGGPRAVARHRRRVPGPGADPAAHRCSRTCSSTGRRSTARC